VISDKYVFLLNSIKTHLVHSIIQIEDDAIMLEIIMSRIYNNTIDKVIDYLIQNEINDDNKLVWSQLVSDIYEGALGIRYPTHHLEDIY
jgi:hypothetical protein